MITFFLFISFAILGGMAKPYCAHPISDDSALFSSSIPPYTLIILDMSGSMRCKVNATSCGQMGKDDAPENPTQRRISIARKILKDLLDVNNDQGNKLNLKLGFMKFSGIDGPMEFYRRDGDGDPRKGNIIVLADIGSSDKSIWSYIKDPNPECSNQPNCEFTGTTGISGCTPLAATLAEAKTYFSGISDPLKQCRKRFIILITDGGDNLACSPPHVPDCEHDDPMHYNKGRVATVFNAKQLYEPDDPAIPKVRVFVVGFGGDTQYGGVMPESHKRLLNWVAKYGGTDNFLEPNSGDPTKYDLSNILSQYGHDPCRIPTADVQAGRDADPGYFDPGNPQLGYPLSGYAFLTNDGSELSQAITAIIHYISEKPFTFTAPTIPSFRTDSEMEGIAYISSFTPLEDRPFWKGTLKAYPLKEGALPLKGDRSLDDSKMIWDAGLNLTNTSPNSRNIFTYLRTSRDLTDRSNAFTKDNQILTKELLRVQTNKDKEYLIDFVRGFDSYDWNDNRNYNEKRDWLLGDIFHSNPVIVGPPSPFIDPYDKSYREFYERHKKRNKVVMAGANDGMLHVFHAGTFDKDRNEGRGGYDNGTGEELWAFIPPSLLGKLHSMTSKASPHTYYVDSSPKVANVKIGGNWKTVLICGLRKGGKSYFALDITDISRPHFLWEFTDSDMGESWSEPSIGKVRDGGNEKWVAFVGGGFNRENRSGKAFYIIDIGTGQVLLKFIGLKGMDYSLAAPPTAVDLNADGYIDRVYMGDLGGQMWVFDISSHDPQQWNGKILFTPRQLKKYPIYYPPTVALGKNRIRWVFFGTGDRENVTGMDIEGRFYAIKDDGGFPYGENDLKGYDLTTDRNASNTFNPPQESLKGWYFIFPKGEKILSRPVVSKRLLYFTTFTAIPSADPCRPTGDARLYIVEYLSGGGALVLDNYLKGTPSDRSKEIGSGIPSSPVISVDSKGNVTITTGTSGSSGGRGSTYDQTKGAQLLLKRMLYWREVTP